jgi:hypothetical protein
MVVGWVMVVVFNATFNNISVISGRSVLLVEETGRTFFSLNSSICFIFKAGRAGDKVE